MEYGMEKGASFMTERRIREGRCPFYERGRREDISVLFLGTFLGRGVGGDRFVARARPAPKAGPFLFFLSLQIIWAQ